MAQRTQLDTIHLHIANYCILLNFSKISELKIKKPLIQMIYLNFFSYLSGFCRNKTDYTLYFIDSLEINLYRKKNEYYIQTFQLKGTSGHVLHHVSIPQLQLLIKILVQKWLLKDGGFYFHASSVIYKDKLLLFTGPSTAGKSTIATALNKPFVPFSDDTLIIRYEKSGWYAYQVPMDGNEKILKRTNSYEVKSIFLLKKSKTLKVERMNNTASNIELLINQIVGGTLYKNHLISFFSFINKINGVYLLHFPLNIQQELFEEQIKEL